MRRDVARGTFVDNTCTGCVVTVSGGSFTVTWEAGANRTYTPTAAVTLTSTWR